MAALCTGSYGLSQSCTDDSKQYFFVKLTDSAYRAIEDYERNQNKYTTQAKIQICENGGVISFPTTKESAGQQFTFAIDEIEGSLECIQQKKTQLDVLGSLQYKMRIHANEDVYETTRHRMAVAEETQKKKSTVEIKPNQTDIGRRVKVKNSNNRFPTISSKRELMHPSSTCPNSQSSNLLLNGTGQTILSLSPSRGTANNQQNNINISSNGVVAFGTTTGHITDHNNISLINATGSSISILSTQNYKKSLSNNSLNNITNSNNDNDPSNDNNNNNSNDNNNSNVNKNINSNHSNDNNNNDNNSNNNMNDNNDKNNNIDNIDDKKDNKNKNDKNNNINSDNNNSNINIINNRSISCNGKINSLSTAASSLSSVLSSAAGSGTSGITGGYFSNANNSNIVRTTISPNTGTNSTGNRKNVAASYSKINSRHNIPDIRKRAIRERLIHMLALKSFKKPEIYARLQNEGIRDKEKNLVSSILKDISILRDNTFNLKHQIWNEINEDWPFYTEQEIQILKRRKPQNLTPPLSSDGGSSTSGQSPTSTHNGSPPPAVKRPGLDRGAYYEEPTAKKQRISHFKKETNDVNVSNNTKLHHDTDVNIMGLSYSVLGTEAARRISPRDVTLVNGQNVLCQQELNLNLNHNQNTIVTTNNVNYKTSNCFIGANSNIRQKSPCSYNYDISPNNSGSSSLQNNNINNNNNNNIKNNNINNSNINEINLSNIKEKIIGGDNQQSEFSKSDIGLSASTDNSVTNSFMNCSNSSSSWSAFECNSTLNSDPSLEDLADNAKSNSEDIRVSENSNKYDFSRFKKITTLEQRRKYKTEFGNDYDEYRKLLNEIDSVRTRFNVLAQQLHNARNNDANYRSIKRKIIEEYQRIQSQREHQNIKARFNYLHGKLAHIKKLVNEFDKTLTASDSPVELSLSSELPENTNYRKQSPISPSTRNDSDHSGSRFDLNCDNRLGSSSPPNSMHKTGGTPASFLDASVAYHLPKNGNY